MCICFNVNLVCKEYGDEVSGDGTSSSLRTRGEEQNWT